MKPYRVKVTVRNNLLLSAIEAAGYSSQTEFAKACELAVKQVNGLCGLREPPIGTSGSFTDPAKKIMEVLGCCPSDLWTEEQLTMSLKKNSGERATTFDVVGNLLEEHQENMLLPSPEDLFIESERKDIVNTALDLLSPSQKEVIQHHYGFGDKEEISLKEIGSRKNLSLERIRQIEEKALRTLRNPIKILRNSVNKKEFHVLDELGDKLA